MYQLKDVLAKGEGWVMVFPRGKHYIHKYQKALNFDDKFYSDVEKAWTKSKFKPPYLDKDHDMRESYGNFTAYRVTPEGMEMFLTLNEAGKDLVKSGQYQFLSPTFGPSQDADGVSYDNVVFTVSLVNLPALMILKSLQEQINLCLTGDNTLKGGSSVELKQIIAVRLGLDPSADDSSILNSLDGLLKGDKDVKSLQLSLTEKEGTLTTLTGKVTALENEKIALSNELKAIKVTSLKAEAESAIDEAIACQQFPASLKEMKVKAYMADKESVLAELALIPKKENSHKTTNTGTSSYELSAQERKIAEDAGYDLSKPEDLKLFKDSIGGK